MRRYFLGISAGLLALAAAPQSSAHHSFAVYFNPDDEVTLRGVVTAFRFTNPHGTIAFEVIDERGNVHKWRAETNAPVVLQRRGWNRRSIRPGEPVTIKGWRARDGRNYMRMSQVRDGEGRMIGTAAFGQGNS